MKINQNYQNLQDSYLFSTIARKVEEYRAQNPGSRVIRLGIGDVTLPLGKTVVEAMRCAVEEMGHKETFHGYGPEQGYDFLKEAIVGHYAEKGVSVALNEVFVSDGAKSDVGNILDLFAKDNIVLVPDPVYPVYVDTNIMDGRRIIYMDATADNGFCPLPDAELDADIIYLCSPNNPTGAVYSREQLKSWVNYALEKNAVIFFDAAYEAFISDPALPSSIFQIEGARECAIEFCSFSKTAGFTGTRCGYTVIPENLKVDGMSLNRMWNRRQTTKFNGVSYVVQRGAAAVFTEQGMKECKENIAYYKQNAQIIAQALKEMNIWFTGGEHSPYVFLRCFDGMDSWDFFDLLLRECNVVGTPGSGFGKNGQGFFRLTAFGDRENTLEAMRRIKKLG